ncbi:hypothetical protein ACFS07_36045 [Undibacterium arcticum]
MPETENYQYPGAKAGGLFSGNGLGKTIIDFGGEATIPEGMGALNPALNDKREVKLTMDQLEVLLSMDSFETKGHFCQRHVARGRN